MILINPLLLRKTWPQVAVFYCLFGHICHYLVAYLFIYFLFTGLADSSGNVGAVLEKKLVPLPFTIALSGLINHSKNNFKLGLGFVAGG